MTISIMAEDVPVIFQLDDQGPLPLCMTTFIGFQRQSSAIGSLCSDTTHFDIDEEENGTGLEKTNQTTGEGDGPAKEQGAFQLPSAVDEADDGMPASVNPQSSHQPASATASPQPRRAGLSVDASQSCEPDVTEPERDLYGCGAEMSYQGAKSEYIKVYLAPLGECCGEAPEDVMIDEREALVRCRPEPVMPVPVRPWSPSALQALDRWGREMDHGDGGPSDVS
ncbi:hypothetical protein [Rhizobium sp. NLR22b]|uniref:hypothetical protein n=1 Tax=Rhizobium sp. NLR22b TaxID=2731115 RepID=UPI001C8375E3|nr:hypothetical protein [Rhizobium sp. NLR22b]MBX5242045.1 hypothetical protein [Rhizobium sp. NLR22b]